MNAGMGWRVQGQVEKAGCGWSGGSCGQDLGDRGQWKGIGEGCEGRVLS